MRDAKRNCSTMTVSAYSTPILSIADSATKSILDDGRHSPFVVQQCEFME